ncbi:NAD(P)-dependent oxidoreductase [Hydrogenophilus islandicus]
MTEQVGFIGLGLMGRPMALNLVKAGFEVHVWARRRESMEPLLAAGARAAASPAALAEAVPVTISMVADAPDVAEVTLGPEGVAQGARAGHIHVDMSTIAPGAAQSIAAQLAERRVRFLDAPVSGGEVGAIEGTLTIMVGGDEAAFATVLPFFQAMGKKVTLVGGSGAGQVAKACNQVLTGVTVVAVAEALNLARAAGVDPARVREALLGGSAYSRVLENHGARMLARNFQPGFKAWMHQKDMRIVLEEAHRLKVPAFTSAVAAQLFNALVGSGQGEADSIAVLRLLEAMSGADAHE